MIDVAPRPPAQIDAGDFATWLSQTRAMLRGEAGPEVPCGDCVGCCVSSYPVPVRAHESASLAAIPIQHLARSANHHALIVALPDGRCPMLNADAKRCSIYSHRPLTCRDYDCRIFAAAGIAAGSDDRSVINERVRKWRFSYRNTADRLMHEAVISAAAFIRTEAQRFQGRAASTPTGIAVLAIKAYPVFLDSSLQTSSPERIVQSILQITREFDSSTNA
jgi:Fe-S-cluster containining protein